MSDSTDTQTERKNPRSIRTLREPRRLVLEVGNFDQAVMVRHDDGSEYALTPNEARRFAEVLRWQADMAEQPERVVVVTSEISLGAGGAEAVKQAVADAVDQWNRNQR